MDDEKTTANRHPSQMPGTLSFELTLRPRETTSHVLQVPPGFDFLTQRVTIKCDGPVLLKIERAVARKETAETSTADTPSRFFDDLKTEYPAHLARLVGEAPEEWVAKNTELRRQAEAGDDDAFFKLLGRDPRLVSSKFALAQLVSWRSEFETYSQYAKLKSSPLFPIPGIGEAKERLTAVKKKLRRFGEIHIAFYDQRGHRPLPPAGAAKGLYYAFLCLLSGLKEVFQSRVRRGGEQAALNHVLRLLQSLRAVPANGNSFYTYIAWVVTLLEQLEIDGHQGLTAENLKTLIGARSSKPSEAALELAGQTFGVSADTIERLLQSDDAIVWASRDGTWYALGGRPNYRLADFSEFQQTVQGLTR